MERRFLAFLVLGLLAGPASVQATQTAWLFSGTLTVVGGTGVPSAINVGDPFSAVLHFDTDTPPNNGLFNQTNCFPNSGGDGSVCRHNGAPQSSQYWSDITVNGVNYGDIPNLGALVPFYNSITVRNNAPDPASPVDIVDSYAFSSEQCTGLCATGDQDQFVFVAIKGLDLTLVTDARVLPQSPSPSMNTLRTREWDVCNGIIDATGVNDCSLVNVSGVFNSVSAVPEPSAFALLAGGLVALAIRRRL